MQLGCNSGLSTTMPRSLASSNFCYILARDHRRELQGCDVSCDVTYFQMIARRTRQYSVLWRWHRYQQTPAPWWQSPAAAASTPESAGTVLSPVTLGANITTMQRPRAAKYVSVAEVFNLEHHIFFIKSEYNVCITFLTGLHNNQFINYKKLYQYFRDADSVCCAVCIL